MFHPFRKGIEPSCSYCAFGSVIGEREVACVKKGVVDAAGHCRRFRYDPLKRVPPRPTEPDERHSAEEFEL